VTPFSISDNLLKSLYYFAFEFNLVKPTAISGIGVLHRPFQGQRFSSLYGRAIAIRFFRESAERWLSQAANASIAPISNSRSAA
jgi:hypothetical protein